MYNEQPWRINVEAYQSAAKSDSLGNYKWCCFCLCFVAVFVVIAVALSSTDDDTTTTTTLENTPNGINSAYAQASRWMREMSTMRNYTWEAGAHGQTLQRLVPPDEIHTRSDVGYERLLSIAVCPASNQYRDDTNPRLSALAIYFGQFVDHDITLTKSVHDDASLQHRIATGADELCEAAGTFIDFGSLQRDTGDGGNALGFAPKQANVTAGDYATQWPLVSFITPELDLSQVYGSSAGFAKTAGLRKDNGESCEMLTGASGALPLNDPTVSGVDMANENADPNVRMLLAGDVRGNEQWGLLALQTLFVRAHNARCREDSAALDAMCGDDGDCRFETVRLEMIARYQRIVYEEFLPAILGEDAAGKATCSAERPADYSPPTVLFEESVTQLYRWHNMVNGNLALADRELQQTREASLCDTFFDPREFVNGSVSFANVLAGAMLKPALEMNECASHCLQNRLFGAGRGCLDLTAINMARASTEVAPSLNLVRRQLGLPEYNSLDELTSHTEFVVALRSFYSAEGTVTDAEILERAPLWLLASAERHADGAAVGSTIQRMTALQFAELCKHDVHYYRRMPELLQDTTSRSTAAALFVQNNVMSVEAYQAHRSGDNLFLR